MTIITAAPSIDLDRIRRILDNYPSANRNELLTIAIIELIEVGVNTGPRIVGAARALGFKPEHAGAFLAHSEGSDPARHKWQRDADGTYHAHPT